jgi:hypothetical protein
MHGELMALLIVVLLIAGAAYSGISARAKPRDEDVERGDTPEDDNHS